MKDRLDKVIKLANIYSKLALGDGENKPLLENIFDESQPFSNRVTKENITPPPTQVIDESNPVIPPDLAHDAWLIGAIEHIRGPHIKGKEYFYQSMRGFIKENKPIIDGIRGWFTTTPRFLGYGLDGVAYDIGNNKVLKLFHSMLAFDKAKEAIERLHTNPVLGKTEAMIYDVGAFQPKGILYYYIIEKMKPVRSVTNYKYIEDISDTTINFISKNPQLFDNLKSLVRKNDPNLSVLVKNKVRAIAERISHKIRVILKDNIKSIEEQIPDLSKDWLPSYIEEVCMKYITDRVDLHMGNLGVTNYGKLVYFDPVFSGW